MAQLRFKDLFNNRVFYMAAPGMDVAEATVLGHMTVKCEGKMVRQVRLSVDYGEWGDAIFSADAPYLEPSMSNIRMYSKRRQAAAYATRAEIHKDAYSLLAIKSV